MRKPPAPVKARSQEYLASLSRETYASAPSANAIAYTREQLEQFVLDGIEASLAKTVNLNADHRRTMTEEDRESVRSLQLDMLKEVLPKVPEKMTRRQMDELLFEVAMKNSTRTIYRFAKQLAPGLDRIPAFGVLPTRSPNAFALRVPGAADCAIAFQIGMATFLNRLIKIASEVSVHLDIPKFEKLGLEDLKGPKLRSLVTETLDRYDFLDKEFAHSMLGLIAAGDINLAGRLQVTTEASLVRAEVLHSAETFVLAHELAHVSLGHLDEKHALRGVRIGQTDCQAVTQSQQEEIEADLIGNAILTGAVAEMSKDAPSSLFHMRLAGPDVFFTSVEILTRHLEPFGYEQKPEEDTHPPPLMRRETVRAFNTSAAEHDPNGYGYIFSAILETLDDRNRERVHRIVAGGPGISPVWLE